MKKLIILPVIFMLLFAFCQSEDEKKLNTMTDMKSFGGAIESYLTDNYNAPEGTSMDDMKKLLMPFYIKELPTTDHWGNAYHYKHGTGEGKEDYWLASAGPDGKFEDFQKTGDDIIYHNGQFL